MLGESREEVEHRERIAERNRLRRLCQPASLIRWNPDVSWAVLDRLLDGPEPKPSKWNRYRPWEIMVWWTWKCLIGLQAQRRLDGSAA